MPAILRSIPAGCLAAAALVTAPGAAAELRLEGLDDAQAVNVRAYVRLHDLACDAPEWEVASLARAAPAQALTALEALGHYRATAQLRDDPRKRNCWQKTLQVQPGPVTVYTKANVAVRGPAAEHPEVMRLLSGTPLKIGAPVHHGRYETFKRRLRSLLAERGFFDAKVDKAAVTVASDGGGAQVELVIDSGERYVFGAIDIGDPVLEPAVYRTLITVKAGEPYDARKIATTHRNFLDSGYFQFVNVTADPAEARDRKVPVTIEATAAKARVYTGGVGYATDIGPRFRLNYRNRRINRRGHTLDGRAQWSPVQSLIGAEYRLPFGDDRRDALSLRTGIAVEDTQTSESESYELVLRQTRAMGDGWLRSLFIDARREFYTIGTDDANSTLVIPGMTWSRISERLDPRPASGHRLSVELRGTSDFLGSDTSFVQAKLDARYIRSFGARTRLLSRLSLGTTGKDTLLELPPSVRFYAGGDGSVRGYAYESLGPRDSEGNVIGGSHLVTGSLELDYRLSDSWAVAAFVDSGSAFNDSTPEFSTGAGLGVRWLTAVGPVRIDVATPFDLDRSVRLHLSIGGDL